MLVDLISSAIKSRVYEPIWFRNQAVVDWLKWICSCFPQPFLKHLAQKSAPIFNIRQPYGIKTTFMPTTAQRSFLCVTILIAACFQACLRDDLGMSASFKTSGPVTLSEEQILLLHQKLRDMRHDVNGRLANIVAAAELMRLRPESAAERMKLLLEQPHKAAETILKFSNDFEITLGIDRK